MKEVRFLRALKIIKDKAIMTKHNALKLTMFFLVISLAMVFHYVGPSKVMAYGAPYDAFGINLDGSIVAPGGAGYPPLYSNNGNQWSYSPYSAGYQQSFNPYGYQQSYNPYGYQQSYNPYSYQQSFTPQSASSFAGTYPYPGGLFAGPTGYNPFSSGIPSSFSSNPYGTYSYPGSGINSSSWQWSPSFTPYPFTPPTVIPVYNPYQTNSNQNQVQVRSAPEFFRGEWESDEITDDKGDLTLDRDEETLEIQDSSLSLGEGDLLSFTYTTTFGKAPISFKAEFDSGYTVRFTGTADNQRLMYTAGPFEYFEIKGEYVIKDDSNQTVDSGKFSLMYGRKPTL